MGLRILQSSSGRARLDAAEEFVRSRPEASELVVVAATREAADDFVFGITEPGSATFGLHRFSLRQLISRLASVELADEHLAPASSLGREAIAARAAFDATEQDLIPRLSAVSGLPGFARALSDTLADLRGAGVGGESLDAAGRQTAELSHLLRLFEDQSSRAGVADDAVLAALARKGVLAASHRSLVSSPLLLLDLAVATAAEEELLRDLCAASASVLATVPAGDRRTLEALAAVDGAQQVTAEEPQPGTGLGRLRTFLFSGEGPEADVPDDQVTFFSAPGEGRECVEIARQTLEQARAGVAFDEIAVLVRAPELYHVLLETAFNRAGIPFYFARGTRRPDPSGRAFLSLLACRSEGLSARRFAEYLSFAVVPELEDGAPPEVDDPPWTLPEDEALAPANEPASKAPGAPGQLAFSFDEAVAAPAAETTDSDDVPTLSGSLRAPWKWEELLVEAAVIGGKDRWRRRIDGLEKELRLKLEPEAGDGPDAPHALALHRELANLKHLCRFALPVIERLDALPGKATWGVWLHHLTRLAPAVLRDSERVLAVLAEMQPMAAVGPVGLEEVRVVLTPRLSSVEQARPDSRYGRVFVATAEQARGRSFKVVFVPGLAERVFPQRPREDPLLLDAVREKLSGALEKQDDRANRERLRLRLAVSAAEEWILLSYPRVDVTQARPRVPSFYALDVARATEGRMPDTEELERQASREVDARLAWPAPPQPERAIDPIEHDLAVLGPLLHGPTGPEIKGRARYLLELSAPLGRSLRTRYARWLCKAWMPHDGIVRATANTQEALRKHGLTSRPYSVTALQSYAACPYRFLLGAIYRLEPRREVAPLETLDPLTRGQIIHRIQAETLRALQERGQLPVTPENLGVARTALDETFDRLAEVFQDELVPAIRRVWLDEMETIRADLKTWLRCLADSPIWEPIRFELGFGLPADASRDPHSQGDPVTLDGGWKLRGVVDLVERNSETGLLRVTDHKTGRDSTHDGFTVGGGETLQPALYSLAIEEMVGSEVAEGRLFFCTSRGGFSERFVPLHDLAREWSRVVLRTVDDAVLQGCFPPAPRENACRYCDFRPVCGPLEEVRAQRKDRKLLEELKQMRELP